MKREVEILAPAGSWECLEAAVCAGADAIKEYQAYGTKLCNNDGTFGGSKLDYFIGFPQNEWSCSDFRVLDSQEYYELSDHYAIIGTAVLNN